MEYKVQQIGGGRGNSKYNNSETVGFWGAVKLTNLALALKSLFNKGKELSQASNSPFVINITYITRLN